MSNQQDGSLASVIDAKLVELEHEADAITLEEVYSRYRDYGWDVFERRTGEGGALTAANDNLTEKGLRHFLPYSISKCSRFQTMTVASREESLS